MKPRVNNAFMNDFVSSIFKPGAVVVTVRTPGGEAVSNLPSTLLRTKITLVRSDTCSGAPPKRPSMRAWQKDTAQWVLPLPWAPQETTTAPGLSTEGTNPLMNSRLRRGYSEGTRIPGIIRFLPIKELVMDPIISLP